jgi:hypothetical protein
MAADYVYKNTDDSIRVRIFKRLTETSETLWDFDVFTKADSGVTGSAIGNEGSVCRTKRGAKELAEWEYGELKSINPENDVLEGW